QNETSIKKIGASAEQESILQTVQADLTDMDDVRRLCQEVCYAVHAIVFVSGTAQFGLFQNVLEEDMERMLTLHVKAPWMIVQHFLPEMLKRCQGKVILITSIWGDRGASNEVIY